MTELGADYSWARPGGAALQSAGVVSVGRYLAPLGDGRAIEAAEFNDLQAHGISVWFVREGAASGILGGYGQGVSDAQVAEANLARIGQQGSVVYAAADFDVQNSEFAACDDYMRGFASVLGLPRVGIYAGAHYINHVRGSLAVWYWQAGATSWNHGEGGAVHIEQTTQPAPVAGSDHNIIYVDNHGQTGYKPKPIPVPIPVEDEMANCAQMRYTRSSDKTVIGLVYDTSSGFYFEWAYGAGSVGAWVDKSLDAGGSIVSTEGLRNVIVAGCNRVLAGKK